MNAPTEGHSISLEMMEQLGKNRPGRAWLRENIELWDENAQLCEDQAAKLREMASKARGIIDAAKDKEPTAAPENGGDGISV